jgi:hypothetical protein
MLLSRIKFQAEICAASISAATARYGRYVLNLWEQSRAQTRESICWYALDDGHHTQAANSHSATQFHVLGQQ